MIERIAGKDYTTLANIERMRELCRVEGKGPACISVHAPDANLSGSSLTKAAKSAQARATLKAALKANPNLPEAKEAVEVVGSATP